jgi:hypothetical protein
LVLHNNLGKFHILLVCITKNRTHCHLHCFPIRCISIDSMCIAKANGVTDVMHALVSHHIGPVLYCIKWAMWGPALYQKNQCGVPTLHKFTDAMQCTIIWVHFPYDWCASPFSLCSNALLKQCNTNTRQFITLFFIVSLFLKQCDNNTW